MRRDDGGVRARILDAAIEVLRDSGVQRLTQVRVAKAASVRQSHLTYYFPKRQDLLGAVTARVVDTIALGVRDAAAETDIETDAADPGPMLERLCASVSDIGHMRMFVGVIIEADHDPALRRVAVRATRRMEAALMKALGAPRPSRRGPAGRRRLSRGARGSADARERARGVLAAIWGLGLYHFLVRPRPSADPKRAYLSWLGEASNPRSQ